MPLPKLPKSKRATKPILVTPTQHKKILGLAKRLKKRTTEIIDEMIVEFEEHQ